MCGTKHNGEFGNTVPKSKTRRTLLQCDTRNVRTHLFLFGYRTSTSILWETSFLLFSFQQLVSLFTYKMRGKEVRSEGIRKIKTSLMMR